MVAMTTRPSGLGSGCWAAADQVVRAREPVAIPRAHRPIDTGQPFARLNAILPAGGQPTEIGESAWSGAGEPTARARGRASSLDILGGKG
jgi:hypothetical protein